MLELRNIDVAFAGRNVLQNLSLQVADREVVSLLGASGSGKSTVLRVTCGITRPSRGHVRLDGTEITQLPTHRRSVGMVFQDEQLFAHMTVAENIGFGLRMAKTSAREIDTRVGELLELVELNGFGPRRVTSLSGGEAKRVALARSLAPRPKVLLLDEPLTGLDAALHARLVATLHDVIRAVGVTAIHVTHDVEEATRIADRVVQLADLNERPQA